MYTTPAFQAWNPDCPGGAGRTWDAPAVRFNTITAGQPFTVPNSTVPEYARGFYVGTVASAGTVTIRPLPEVNATGIPGDADVVVTIPREGFYPFSCSMIVAIDATLDNLVWIS